MNESVLHYAGVRYRISGSGILKQSLKNIDSSETVIPADIDMGSLTNSEPFAIASLVSQRAKLRIETQSINDQFQISRIILYVKPIWESLPG